MPNENTTIYSSTKGNHFRQLTVLIAVIVIGVILVVVFNKNNVPFGRSLNSQPFQLIGLVMIVAATFGIVILCIRCLVLSEQRTLVSNNTSYTTRRYSSQPNAAWQLIYPIQSTVPTVSRVLTEPHVANSGFGSYHQSTSGIPSGQTYTQRQVATPQTPPPEFEFPPSYAEATKGLPVIKQ